MSTDQNISKLQSLLREPTFHFFIMAMVIFAVYGISSSTQESVLELDQREIDARLFMQEMASGQALSEEQREYLTSAFVEEQILVQEALKMGLDNDARIHDILAQKMRHVLSGDVIQPSQEELQTFYDSNLERYRSLPSLDANEIVFNTREELPVEVSNALSSGADADTLLELEDGNADPLPNVNKLDLSNIFDDEFAERVFITEIGAWQGPFLTNRGQHWLQVTSRRASRLPPLTEIRDRVRLEWIAAEEDLRLQTQIDRLWEQYSVRIGNAEAEH